MLAERILRLKGELRKKKKKALFITDITNIRYLTGFTGSHAYLLVSDKGDVLFTDFRYKEQSARDVSVCRCEIINKDITGVLGKYAKGIGIRALSVQDTITYRQYKALSKHFELTTLSETVEGLRAIKDASEVELIKQAIQRAEDALAAIKGYIKAGVTERAISLRLEDALRKCGVDKLPFYPIVASGRNSALPHIKPTEKKLEKGDLVVIDWGGESGGYFSDMTRTFLVKGPDVEKKVEKKKEIYDVVLRANTSAIEGARAGLTGTETDAIARKVIKDAGFGQYFGHGTGHGVGLEVHERPRISLKAPKTIVADGMVFTVEPAIYIPDLGGVRIEDMVVVSGGRAQRITTLPRSLEIV
ncbi:M24 family metallopeptidase [Candidatus Magnetobacterium casense]|uniref:Aminopeptidase P family protein n=1 Tax=Candidatus Magnetobacterium casense TaxID=1455061 RepID=A0ABS6S3M9_9BACT|nr:Xaa-Pro peptidase family protein [Candidatus Magnetobacterium casensis]MBV6343451.1 aminopeptidase P family protein [Candidatus Magnetobacterium casensis]